MVNTSDSLPQKICKPESCKWYIVINSKEGHTTGVIKGMLWGI